MVMLRFDVHHRSVREIPQVETRFNTRLLALGLVCRIRI
jgi:hypothetical protein